MVVAVAKKPVGVDVEVVNNERFGKFQPERILSSEELKELEKLSSNELNRLWTVKEAVFKRQAGEAFLPSKINTTNEKYVTKLLKSGEECFYLTVASDDCHFAKFHIDEDLILEDI